MRPMRSTLVTIPVEMKAAQTPIALAAKRGEESDANAGVNAELI